MIDIEYKCPLCRAINRAPRRLVTQPSICRYCREPVLLTFENDPKPDKEGQTFVPIKDMISFPIRGWVWFLAGMGTLLAIKPLQWWFGPEGEVLSVWTNSVMVCTGTFVYIVVLSSCLVALDVKRLRLSRPDDAKQGLQMWSLGWFLGCLFLWLPMFPLYLIIRNSLARTASSGGGLPENAKASIQPISKISFRRLPFLLLKFVAVVLAFYWVGPCLVPVFAVSWYAYWTQWPFDVVDVLALLAVLGLWVGVWLLVGVPALMVAGFSSFMLSLKLNGVKCVKWC